MSKVSYTALTSGYNLAQINANFKAIVDIINNNVFFRTNSSGEDNALYTNMDANGKRIINLPAPLSSNEPARLIDVQNAISSAPVWGTITGSISSQYDLQAALAAKQNTLVSGSNLKTINGNSLLGSGDLTIASGGGTGTVTSVAASVPSFLSVTGSPITTSGTLAITYSGTALPVANGGTGATSLTANGVLVGNGTSAVTTVAPGTSGNVLTSNGTSWVSQAPVGGSGGAWTKISTQTVSAVTNIDWTGLSGYSRYAVIIENVSMSGAGYPLVLRFGYGSTTWSTTTYMYQYLCAYTANTQANSSISQAYVPVAMMANAAQPIAINGIVYISALNTTTPQATSDVTIVSSTAMERDMCGGMCSALGGTGTAIRFTSPGAYTITGTFSLYGIS